MTDPKIKYKILTKTRYEALMECWYDNHCACCETDINTKSDGSYGQCYDNFNCIQDCGKNFCDDCYEKTMGETDDGLTCLECIKKYNIEVINEDEE